MIQSKYNELLLYLIMNEGFATQTLLNPSCRFFLRMAKFYYSVAILFGRQPVIIQFQNYIPTYKLIYSMYVHIEWSYYFLAELVVWLNPCYV